MSTFHKLTISLLCFTAIRYVTGACDGAPNVCPAPQHCSCQIGRNGVNMTCVRSQRNPGPGLKSVPSKLPVNLLKLRINRHSIEKIRDSDFSNCSDLEIIYLEQNIISSVMNGSFADSPNIHILCLNKNNIDFSNVSHSFPLYLLKDLHNITELWIDQNSWGGSNASYRDDLFLNKPHLQLLAMDGIKNAVFPTTNAPASITELRMYEGIPHLTRSTFRNWTGFQLEKLHVVCLHRFGSTESKTCLQDIDPGACSVFRTLKELDLSYNEYLEFGTALQRCMVDLKNTSITKLILNSIVKDPTSFATALSSTFLNNLKPLNLTVLKVEGNGLTYVEGNMTLSEVIPNIRILSLAYNRFFGYDMNILRHVYDLKELVSLDLKCQTRLYNPPNPNYALMMNRGEMSTRPILIISPPKIKVISLSDAFDEGDLDIGTITLANLPNVSMIDLSRNKINRLAGEFITIPLSRIPHIGVLNLSDCDIGYINSKFFGNNIRIHTLDLSRNIDLGAQLTNDRNGTFMASLAQVDLRVLNLSLTNIKYIHPHFFSTIDTLQELIIRNAAIGGWYADFEHMTNMKMLDLSYNNFMYLLPAFIKGVKAVAKHNSFTLDISKNPLEVECPNLDFLFWITHSSPVQLKNNESLTFFQRCPDGSYKFYNLTSLVSEVQVLEVDCHARIWVIVSGTFVVFAMVLTCVLAIVHRQRWDIRYFCLRLARQRRTYERLENTRDYRYDAFIVYHNQDIRWVKHQLIPHLEQTVAAPLKLCIHERDWIPGHTIEDNICSSVQDSRKTVFLLTRQSLRSRWGEFEMQMARMRSIDEGEDIIIVVALEEIPVNEMHTSLVNLRRSSTWLEWDPDNREEQVVFWKRLREAVRHPGDIPSRCLCGRSFYPDSTFNHYN